MSIYSSSYEYEVTSLEGRDKFGVAWDTEVTVFLNSKEQILREIVPDFNRHIRTNTMLQHLRCINR